MRNLAMFIPDQLLPVLIVAGGLLIIIGSRARGMSLVTLAIATPLLGVLASIVFDLLPMWLVVVLLVFAAAAVLRGLFETLLGKGATEAMVGHLAADSLKFAVVLPFKLIASAVRALFRLAASLLRH